MANQLAYGINQLSEIPTRDQKLCYETLIKIYRNVIANPKEPKFRSLKLSNKRFMNEVWRHKGAQIFMQASGWTVLPELIHLPDGVDLTDSLSLLVDNRQVKPDEAEWVEGNKIIGENKMKIREDELRRKALEEKQKEMVQLKKDMVERKEIANRILREHRDDINKRKTNRPSVATPKGSGKTAKMTDIVAKQGGG